MRHNPYMAKYEAVPRKYEACTIVNIRELIPSPIQNKLLFDWWYSSETFKGEMEV